MNLNKNHTIIICMCALLGACSTEYYNTKWLRKCVREHAEAMKLEPCHLLSDELQNVDYEMDSCERMSQMITDTFTVQNIFEGNNVFEIILVSSKNKHYEVYSPYSPQTKCRHGVKIKEGRQYIMTIVPYFKKESRRSRPIEIVRIVFIKGYLINPYPLYFGQVYYIDNLDGLYLLSGDM